jgi:hypothetical protein
MDTWYKIAAVAPYVVALLYGLGYFFKKKDKKKEDESTLLHDIKTAVEQIQIQLQSDKGHLSHIDIEQDVHERWLTKVVAAIGNIRIYHKTQHNQEMDMDLERPEPLKII